MWRREGGEADGEERGRLTNTEEEEEEEGDQMFRPPSALESPLK